MPRLTLTDGDQICFEHYGSGTSLFLVSGLAGRAEFWSSHIEKLSKQYLVVTHDHRGTGSSTRRRMSFSIEQMSSDVIALADHLGIEQFHILGHSTGGAIAQTLALDHSDRIRGLVLSATWAGKDSYIESLFSLRRDVLEEMGLNAYHRLANIMLKPSNAFADLLPTALVDNLMEDGASTAGAIADDTYNTSSRIRALLEFDRRADLHRIKHRTLISCATDDVIIPPHCSDELHDGIADSILKKYSSGGHAYTNVLEEEFRSDLMAFLKTA